MKLVERESELDALTALLDGLGEGRSRAALIEGPAGIGKTKLLAELREQARERRIPALGARGSELEREFPFGVVRQMLEPALLARPNRGELFEGAAEVAGAIFAPPGEDSLGGDASFAVLHGLYWLILDLVGDQPTLLTIDDLQWCDRPSLRALAYVVRRLEGIPLLIVATLRSNEPGTDPALLAEIAQDPATERIQPGPLSPAAMPVLIERRLGTAPDGAFAAACHEATGGNPLLLDELLARRFLLKDLSTLYYFLGVEVVHHPQGFLLSQQRYIAELLVRTKMTDARLVTTPLATSLILTLKFGTKF